MPTTVRQSDKGVSCSHNTLAWPRRCSRRRRECRRVSRRERRQKQCRQAVLVGDKWRIPGEDSRNRRVTACRTGHPPALSRGNQPGQDNATRAGDNHSQERDGEPPPWKTQQSRVVQIIFPGGQTLSRSAPRWPRVSADRSRGGREQFRYPCTTDRAFPGRCRQCSLANRAFHAKDHAPQRQLKSSAIIPGPTVTATNRVPSRYLLLTVERQSHLAATASKATFVSGIPIRQFFDYERCQVYNGRQHHYTSLLPGTLCTQCDRSLPHQRG